MKSKPDFAITAQQGKILHIFIFLLLIASVMISSPCSLWAGWTKILAGDHHTLAIKDDGTLWSWGFNNDGQLGNGTLTNSPIPIKISTYQWIDISAGAAHSLAIKSDGTLWAWGSNVYGQLGDGTNTQDW